MYISLRTTVFWNMVILMLAAIVLICMVVVRITQRELFGQCTSAGMTTFAAVRTLLPQIIQQHPHLFEDPLPGSEPDALFADLVREHVCKSALLVNTHRLIVASDGQRPSGLVLDDHDIRQALDRGTVVTTVRSESGGLEPCLTIAGPVFCKGSLVGALKIILPLGDAVKRLRTASQLIVLYTCLNAVILVAVGYFLMSRYVVAPLKKLTRLSENIAGGAFDDLPLFFSEKNEIGKLSAALRSMMEKLLRERNRIEAHARELAEKNAQLQCAQRELLQSEKLAAVGRLAAGIAHEIGNPLGIILGYLHMLRSSDIGDRERQDYLERIEKEIERVHGTISNLLEFSRPAPQKPQACSMNEIVRDVCDLVSEQKDFQTIAFRLDLAENLPQVFGHETLLRQMVMNLVLNSRDAMPDGGTLTVATSTGQTGNGSYVVLTVSDTGTGIPAEHLDKIFDPFFTTKQQGKGTGLGLANVHRIVDLSGGTISVTSTPGQGTTFTITLPAIENGGARLQDDSGYRGLRENDR